MGSEGLPPAPSEPALRAAGFDPGANTPMASAGADAAQTDGVYQPVAWKQSGIASTYGGKFHGRRTASGERFNANKLTAAHRVLKFGTRVLVTRLSNGLSVIVRITDRGPFHGERIIDLSTAAARVLGMRVASVMQVTIEALPD